jgi:phosphinothricin acetyltransferase
MDQHLRVRPFEARDADAVATIYNQGIAERIATFETEPRTGATVKDQFTSRTATHPAVVVERNSTVIAVAWTSEYRPRAAYSGIAEFSVYVAREARGLGAGRLALSALIEAAEAKGFWKLVSRIFPENLASRQLCNALGFREVGIYRRHGRLDGEWRDCVIVERLLGEAGEGISG